MINISEKEFEVKQVLDHTDGCKERVIVARGFAPDQDEASFRFAARGSEMRTFGGQVLQWECTCWQKPRPITRKQVSR